MNSIGHLRLFLSAAEIEFSSFLKGRKQTNILDEVTFSAKLFKFFATSPVTKVLLRYAERISLKFRKIPTFSCFSPVSNPPSSCTRYRWAYSGHSFSHLLSRKRNLHLCALWDTTSKGYKSEFWQRCERSGPASQKPAPRRQSLRWFNAPWNCFSRYACFKASAVSTCRRARHQQHSVNAPSVLSCCAEGCYPHIAGRKRPSPSILIKNPKLFLH